MEVIKTRFFIPQTLIYMKKLIEKIKKKFNSLTNKELEEITKAQKEFDEL